jgi:flavin-dependent dehydrogenase
MTMNQPSATPASTEPIADEYDVVVLGGALSGSSATTLLMRNNPGIRVLVIERTERLTRRVGEATVEVSAYFMGRVLGLTKYLNEHHIVKQGLRFWFKNEKVSRFDEASEVGGRYQVRLPSYQLDRATFDEEVLRRAAEVGAQIIRPAVIRNVELCSGGQQTVEFKYHGETRSVKARWVVDATGVASFLARKNGWWVRNTEHPTASAWSRWKGVKDWDGLELAQKYPEWAKSAHSVRGTATNHIMGDGWWSWWIPLKGGDTSVGVVFDQRIVPWEETGSVGERLKSFLMKHPVAAEVLEGAEYEEDDVHWRRNLAYYSTTFAGDGFVIVGDAAAFMDPFYSPGMDWIAFSTSSAANLIKQQRDGGCMETLVSKYNRDFSLCHQRWFSSLYKDKYHYLAEFDLMSLAFRLDLSLYYWGVVQPPFTEGPSALLSPPFSPVSGKIFSGLMGCYNRRFATIAKRRRRLGLLGRNNNGNRLLIPGFTLERKDMFRLFGLLKDWAVLELKEGWKTWGRSPSQQDDDPLGFSVENDSARERREVPPVNASTASQP